MFRGVMKILVLLVGTCFACLPAIAVHWGLTSNAQENGDQLVKSIAATMIERADTNVRHALDILSEFTLHGVTTCSPANIEKMKKAVHGQFWVKELGVVDGAGNFKCNQFGDTQKFANRSKGVNGDSDNIIIQTVLREESSKYETMITWRLDSDLSLGAVLPGEALADDVIPSEMRDKGVAIVTASNGTLLYMAPSQDVARADLPFDDRTFTTSLYSKSFPYYVTVLAPYDVIWAWEKGFYKNSLIIAASVGVVLWLLLLLSLKPRKARTNEIEAAIEAGEFIPFYQPTIDVQTGALRGCEVLIRWRKPDGSILPPGAFIALAEATGLAIPMTRALMMNVVDDMEDLHEMRPDLKLGINLFDDHFENLDIVEDIKAIFGPSKISYSQLMFEVTERQPLNDIERARIVIRNMRSLGCKVALDDAGTGHGGLAYLQQLGLDVIKIDKLFIDAIGTDSLSAPIVDSLINLAESLGMEVVAEGVEETLQVEYLREKGVSLAQGYLFAKPLPYETYKRLIERMVPLSKTPEERRRSRTKERFAASPKAA